MPGLFDPIEINRLGLKNRLVMAPMGMKMAGEEGDVTDRVVKHYSARARGGVGLIIVEHTYVCKNGKFSAGQLGIYDNNLVPGFRRLVEAIHSEGAKAVLQITHAGAKSPQEVIGEQPTAPSDVIPPGDKNVPRPLTVPEINGVVRAFGKAACRALDAGFDAVELHGAHGYLLCQFLSPYTNKRADNYGGNLQNRLRFPLEVITEVKNKVGKGVPLFYRLGADDRVEGGLTPEEGRLAAQCLEQAGVDVIDISGGLCGSRRFENITEQGYFVPLAQSIKAMVKVPVIGVGHITEPEYADRIVREGRVDLVALGRILLSKPEFPREAASKLGALI